MASLTERIRVRAYFRWQNRSPEAGDALGDWLAAEREETRATLYFDECGTPATTETFIVGGYAIYGDPEPTRVAWEALLSSRSLPKKGRKYSHEDMEAVAAFIVDQRLLPITSHAQLEADDLSAATGKIAELSSLAAAAGVENDLIRRAGSYVWITQVVLTVGPSMISLLLRRGDVTRVRVGLDQFTLPQRLYGTIERLIRNSLDPTRYETVRGHGSPEAALLASRVRYTVADCEVDLSARGKLALLSDTICAMYSRDLNAGAGGYAPWQAVLQGTAGSGTPPAAAARDLTKMVRQRVRAGWPVPPTS